MIRTIPVLLLALCLCLTAACGAEDVLQSMTESVREATAAPTEEAEAVFPTEEASDTDTALPYTDSSGTDTAPVPEAEDTAGWTGLSAEECVQEQLSGERTVPLITVDCPGAEEINRRLAEEFVPLAEDPMCEGMYYEYCKGFGGRILSVLMEVKGPNDTIRYTPFNLDLATGEQLTAEQLLTLLNVDAEHLRNLEQAVMGEEFTHLFGTAQSQTDPGFYDQQYQRTTSPDNTNVDTLWFSGDGQLCFVGRIYGLAGAEYYEWGLGSTLFF